MTNTVETYQGLITSEFQSQPNFMATVALGVAVQVRVQELLDSMIPIFDIDQNPVGNQLDIIGQWVGVSRNIPVPISEVYFSWDTAGLGWESGVWQNPIQPTAITVLPDDVYLNLIRARIAANSWDGTTEGAYAIWDKLFPNLTLLIIDNQNMSFAIGIQGSVPDALTIALLTGGFLPLRPEGVKISEYFIPVDTNPLFSWDCNSPALQGWDTGSWASELVPT